ncbi:hypothetical protein FBU30_003932 [Linnemannia zychae]|nr:hypothetical protein FBU30_003932 [Linnemannia zychae]
MTSVMTGLVPLAQTTLTAGGPVIIFFGFITVFLVTSTIALSLADIASGFPNVKGGLIEYSRRLAPPKFKRIAPWFLGWLHFSAFATGACSCAFAFALFATAIVQIVTEQVPQRWVTVLIHVVTSILFGVLNAYDIYIDIISIVWHVVGPIIILLVIAITNKSPPPATWVFTHFENQTGWSSSFYVALIGISQSAFTMTGYDAPIHTMHSVENAAWKVPQGIFSGLFVSVTMGSTILLTLLFGINDINAIINPAVSGISAIEIFINLIGTTGTIIITVIFMGTFFFCGQGVLKACSQVGQEMAVSGAFPKSEYFAKLTPKGQPARMGWVCSVISCGIGALYLFNTTALQALTSAVAIELNIVYSIPIALRLFYPNPTAFQPGPFSLGILRKPIAIIALTWTSIGMVMYSLPGFYPITTDNMNYASILLFATVSMTLGYWYFSARHWFDLDRQSDNSSGSVGGIGRNPKTSYGSEMVSTRSGAGVGASMDDRELDGIDGSCDNEKDLDEIEDWLDDLERDLKSPN